MTLHQVILGLGIYYFATGVWPLLHLRSFEKVTGEKTDKWLVHTVSLMIVCSSLVYLYASQRESIPNEVLILAVSNCLVLLGVDVYFSIKGIIRKVYLADALIELLLLISIGVSYVGTSK